MKRAEYCWYRTDDAFHTFELVAIFTPDSRHLRPMGQRTQVVLLVVAIVESQQVVKRTVVTHRVCIALRRRGAVVFVIVLYIDKSERQEDSRQIAEQDPLPGDRDEQA